MSKIIITSNYQCNKIYKEFNELIKRIINVRSIAKTDDGYLYDLDTYDDLNSLKLVLTNILYEKTNIKEVLRDNKYYLDTDLMNKTFNGLDPDSDELYKEFLANLDKLFDVKERSYLYFFPLNLTFKTKNTLDCLNEILELFKMKKIEIDNLKGILNKTPKKNFKEDSKQGIHQKLNKLHQANKLSKEEVFDYLKDYDLILSVEVAAKHSHYANSVALYLIESFLGLLSFSEYMFERKFLPIESTDSSNEIKYDEYVMLGKDGVIWPKKYMMNRIRAGSQRKIKFKNFNTLIQINEKISTITSEGLWNLLQKLFFLYYKASSEDRTEYAFLNYWIIAETIIKGDKRARTDDEVKSIMKSVIENDLIQKRIDYLDKKRNNIVHRGEIVTVEERDLIKIVADKLLLIAVLEMGKIKNKKQFGYYISNIKNKNRDNYIEVLDLLNKEENEK